jgi:hypothetical protein
MTSPPKDILVIGATGLIGKFILDQIIAAKSSFGRIVVFTSENTFKTKADFFKARDVEVVVGDLTNEDDIQRAYSGIDTVISAVGRPIIDAQIKLVEIAEATPNVKYFYPSEFGTDIEYGPTSKDEKPHQAKLRVRKYIKDNVKRIQYTYLVTGPYADSYISKTGDLRVGGFKVDEKKGTLLGTGKERISLTTMREYVLVLAYASPY